MDPDFVQFDMAGIDTMLIAGAGIGFSLGLLAALSKFGFGTNFVAYAAQKAGVNGGNGNGA